MWKSITLVSPRQETPKVAEWCGGKLHHMTAIKKILTTHYLTNQSAVVSLLNSHTHTHTHTHRNHLRNLNKYLNMVLTNCTDQTLSAATYQNRIEDKVCQ